MNLIQKPLYIFVVALLSLGTVNNSNAQKSLVRRAYSFLSVGNLKEAKKAIDNAVKDEKIANKPRTQLYRSYIYSGLALDKGNPNVTGELNASYDALKKAIELDRGRGIIEEKNISDGYNRLYTASYNKCMKAYEAEKMSDALKYLQFAAKIKPNNISLYVKQAAIAQKAYDNALAIESYEKLLALGYDSLSVYRNLSKLYTEEDNESAAARIINKGLEKYPNNEGLLFDDLTFLIKEGDIVEAIDELKTAAKLQPNNATIWYSLGIAHLKDKNRISHAEEYFKKALEIKPDYYKAYYNLGMIYYNSAATIINQANEKSAFINKKEYATFQSEYTDELKVSEAYFEKAYAINPKDINLLISLREVYARLGQTENAQRKKAEMFLLDN